MLQGIYTQRRERRDRDSGYVYLGVLRGLRRVTRVENQMDNKWNSLIASRVYCLHSDIGICVTTNVTV